ncbi:MAG: methyltransferase domain-containing protein [Acidobacteriaceae bacterium]|jgi:cytosine/adenosine deaminase-related metal-dependent hydrolase/ubiquinone/menaquinone biosynthesis C-methylase UbiE
MKQISCFPAEAFDTWADVYDSQPNPLLALEQRFLGPMLPDVRGLDVLDAGCGTGRWLHQLADKSPRSLLGADISPQMLLLAAAKVGHDCDLRLGSCTALPFNNGVADVVLSCFVLSYVDDLEAFAKEMDRVARPGTTIFLTDMHPETEASHNWNRSFAAEGSSSGVQTMGWSLQQITQAFLERGFQLVSLVEPAFSLEERRIFEQCGRLDLYDSAAALPAIYILQLRKHPSSTRVKKPPQSITETIRLTGTRCALGPDAAAPASVSMVGKYIHSIRDRIDDKSESNVDLSGYLLLPGLINGHDHLEFSLFPNIGDGPYQNSTQWAHDIQSTNAHLIAQHRKVPRPIRLWWGAVRNLLCGVTTVCHHNPVTPELVSTEFPIRVVSDFGWAHSLSLEPQLASKFAESDAELPFIIHAAEGVDVESMQEVFELDRMGALDQRTVLVHGLACSPEAVSLINRRFAAVILCPTSNGFLFDKSPSLAFIRSLDTVALGSDSPLTAAGDLLDEIAFAHSLIGLDTNSVYGMVTNRAADVLRLRQGEGRLWPGSVADVVGVRDIGLSPAETLAQLTIEQVELVIVGGRVQLASPPIFERLPLTLREGLQLLKVDGHQRWLRAPIEKLLAGAEEFLGSDLRLGGKRVRRASAA